MFIVLSSWQSHCESSPGHLMNVQGAPIKNNPLEKLLYISNGSTSLSQPFALYIRVFTQHILQIS